MHPFSIAFGALALLGTALPAYAFPPPGAPIKQHPGYLNPGTIDLPGPAQATVFFAYADTADTSQLTLPAYLGPIVNNKLATIGTATALGLLSGAQVFGLDDLSTGVSFKANVADVNGHYHAKYSANCSDVASCETAYAIFNTEALAPVITGAIAGLPTGTNVVFVGWEDRVGLDFDHNDLIFAVTNLVATPVPEPASMLLLGAALASIGATMRRKFA